MNDEIWKIRGFCVGSVGTNLRLPALNLAFDIGRCSEASAMIGTVAITHGHMDHIGGVGHHCARRALLKRGPTRYVMGPEISEGFDVLMNAFRALDKSPLAYEKVVLSPGERLDLGKGRYLQPFRSHHVVPCQGYCVWSTKQKLKTEYVGLEGREIATLKRDGTEITDTIHVPEVAYTGDTTIDVLETAPEVSRARVLVIECTFWDDQVDAEKARMTRHIHLDHIVAMAEKRRFMNDILVLTHFSARHTREDIEKGYNERLKPLMESGKLPKVILGGQPCERAVKPI